MAGYEPATAKPITRDNNHIKNYQNQEIRKNQMRKIFAVKNRNAVKEKRQQLI
jgi:hypothetical protein